MAGGMVADFNPLSHQCPQLPPVQIALTADSIGINKQRHRKLVFAQKRHGNIIKGTVSIIDREGNSPLRQGLTAAQPVNNLRQRNNSDVIFLNIIKLLLEDSRD